MMRALRKLGFLVLSSLTPGTGAAADERITGYQELSPELQMVQDDPFKNPGMLWVGEGESLWAAPVGEGGKSCASCHADAASMQGVAARYPAFDEQSGRITDLTGRIMSCQSQHQGVEPFERESRELLALTAFVARQSAGLPITPDPDPRLSPWRQQGAALFQKRLGQLNLSCSQCHNDYAGERLLAAVIPQAHPTGYPQYRLEWEGMGSLQRRLNNCLTGVRATPFTAGSDEYVALELYLMDRASGLPIEAPAIRP
ncbi:sulfur oxidation c-type cytochrome SoxA [Mesorhizobium sp. KR2-14]|uniref:sulfur oxidation c-type cytochrome SoxA n=1 Tax=Mesorhizobium sp. KR2-14 TaxID=3156610 RepID=UPI0032B4DA85